MNLLTTKRIGELEQEHDILKSLGHFQPADPKQLHSFIRVHANCYAVQVLCRVLGVSRSAYYRWCGLQQAAVADEKKKVVEQQVLSVFIEHRWRCVELETDLIDTLNKPALLTLKKLHRL